MELSYSKSLLEQGQSAAAWLHIALKSELATLQVAPIQGWDGLVGECSQGVALG